MNSLLRVGAFSLMVAGFVGCGSVNAGGGGGDGGEDGADSSGGTSAGGISYGSGGASSGGMASGGALVSTGGAASGGASSGGASTGGTSAGSGGASSGGTTAGTGGVNSADLVWGQASLTNYESYPDPGSDECVNYNGCTWAGYFAALDGKQTEDWVKNHNIVAVFAATGGTLKFSTYKLHTLRLRQGGDEIDVTVYDTCGDSDCDGCCTQNAKAGKNLIDIEKYTMARFNGRGDGTVEWACLDCD